MNTTKEEAIEIVSRLPEEVSWDEIIYQLYVRKKIEEGIEAAEAGHFVSQEEVKRLFSR
jgi:predicted transcriptional regulator